MMMIENEPDPLRRIPTKSPSDVHAEIGETLRAARAKRGLSLEAVSQQTRIARRFLQALEENRFDEFPAFVYLQGFLKSYCEHLDLPFDELWAKIQPAEAPAPAPAAAGGGNAHAQAHPPAAAKSPAAAHPAHDAHAPAAPTGLGALILAGALALGLTAWIMGGRGGAVARPSAPPPKALMPLPRAVEPKVALRAVDDAWIRVTVDGGVVFEGRVPKGAAMEWKPARVVTLRAASPAAVELTVNGAPYALANPGPDGEYRIDVP